MRKLVDKRAGLLAQLAEVEAEIAGVVSLGSAAVTTVATGAPKPTVYVPTASTFVPAPLPPEEEIVTDPPIELAGEDNMGPGRWVP